MFHTLHRIVVIAGWSLVVAAGYMTFRSVDDFGPAFNWVAALMQQKGVQQKIVEKLDGRVVRVHTGDMLEVEDRLGFKYMIRLTGLTAPAYRPADKATKRPSTESLDNLSRLTLSKEVRVDVTYVSTRYSGLGIVYVGETNVNVAQVSGGFAALAPELLNGLPIKVKYEMIQAGREREGK